MNRSKLLVLGLLAVLLVSLVPVASAQTIGLARVRVAHFSPDTPAVQVYLNGDNSGIQTLSFGDVSGWVELPAGTYSVAVAPAGTSVEQAAIGPVSLPLRAGSWTTIAAIGSLAGGTLTATTIAEDYSALQSGESRVTVFHAIEDAPAVDVILPDGTALIAGLAFGEAVELTVPAGSYSLSVVAAGTTGPAVISLPNTRLKGQTYYFVAATNTLAAPQVNLTAIGLGTVAPLINKTSVPTRTIAEIAAGDARFSTLVTALQAAGLVETLNGAGNFTVFAPTNDAFAKLPAGTLEAVLADKNLLTTILLYHVVGGKALASDVVGVEELRPLDGGSFRVDVRDGKVFLNDTIQIILTDIEATNGVIHVIDGVLVP
ncbi:MAG: fasciclin domain-containing protein [Chloroflexi bacterium]|nr:fasciclin domain-containing protein [Chloroflexota bacterium]